MKKFLLVGLLFFSSLWYANAQYCVGGGPSSTADSNVEALTLTGDDGTEIDYVGCPGVVGVEDLTAEVVNLTAGQTYTLDFTIGTCSATTYVGAGQVWIDFNQNEIFDSNESLGTAAITTFNGGAVDTSLTFTVPVTAAAGATRLRVMQWEGGNLPLDPCGSFTWGSVTDFGVDIEVPASDCPFPTDIVADVLSDTEVELTFDGQGEAEWNIEYGLPGFEPGAGEEINSFNTTETTFLVTSLAANTEYTFAIQAVCTSENSFWNTVTAITNCGVETAPFYENFDGTGWTGSTAFNNAGEQFSPCWFRNPENVLTAYGWFTRTGTTPSNFATGPSGDFSGTGNYLYVEASNGINGNEATFDTPFIDVNSLTTPALSFYYHMRGTDIGTLTVEAKADTDTDWTEVFTLTGQVQTALTDPWEQAIVSLAGFENEIIQVRFKTTKIGFNGDVSIDEIRVIESPTCFNVQDLELTSTTADSASFSWTDYPDATEGFIWEVFAEDADIENDVPLFEGTVAAGETSVTVTGLEDNTNYIFVLDSDCGDVNGISFQSSIEEFLTDCVAFVAPYADNFNGDTWVSGTGFNNAGDAIDPCWSRDPSVSTAFFWGTRTGTTGGNFSTGPNTDFSGTGKYVFVESSNGIVGAEAFFTSPLIDLSALADPSVSFYYHMRGPNIGTLTVEAKEAGTADWTEIFSLTGAQQVNAADPWEQVILPLSTFASQTVQIRFSTVRVGFSGDIAIDNFVVDEAPSCFNVTGFSVSPAVTTAELSWDEIPSAIDGYDIEVFLQGEDTPFFTVNVPQNETTFEITGLSEGETYVVTITSNCGTEDGVSDTIESTFTTVSFGDTCEAAIVVDTLPYITTDDTANYSDFYEGGPGADCGATAGYLGGNDVSYSYTPTEDQVVLVTMTPTNTWSGIFVYESCDDIGVQCLNGQANFGATVREFEVSLQADQEYIFVISTWPAPQTTPYTFELNVVLCGAVSGLTSTFVGSDQADFEWDAVPGATGYQWSLFDAGADPETADPVQSGTTADNFLSIIDLPSSTPYDFYVQSECVGGNLGNPTGPLTVVTDCTPESYNTAVEDFSDATFDYNNNNLMLCWSEGTGALTSSMSVNEVNGTWGAGNYANTPNAENGTAARVNIFANGDDWLISQQIDLGDGTDDLVIEYDVSVVPFFGADINSPPVTNFGLHTVSVVVSTDGGATWSDQDVVQVYDNDNIPLPTQKEYVSLEGYTGIVKIGFYANRVSSTDLWFSVDNFRVIIAPTCFPPSDLESQIVGLEDVEFSWSTNPLNDIEDEWEVQYGLEGFELDSDDATSAFATGDPSVVVSGLESASDYEFYVRAICGPDDFSEWAGPAEFRSPIVPIEIGAGELHNETHCYGNFEVTEWLFVSTADEEIIMQFNAGSLEDAIGSSDVLQIYDGFNDEGILLFDSSEDGAVLSGLTFTSTTGGFYLILTTDIVQSCQGGQGVLPEEFDFDVISETFSTPGFSAEEFTLYPNPVQTNLYLQSANPIEGYALFTMAGKRVLEGRPNLATPTLDMQNLPTGVYLLKVTIQGRSETFQVIKR